MNDAISAGTITIAGHEGDEIEAYLATPVDRGPCPGVVVIHHMPGYDRPTKEIARTFAVYGYSALCPNLFHRYAPGAKAADGAAAARAAGGVPDEQAMGDVAAAAAYLRALPDATGNVGVIGYCSRGRKTFLASCLVDVDAAVDCYGGRVAILPSEPPGPAPLDLASQMRCPLLGLFGADDANPSPAHVAVIAEELTKLGKPFEFHTYEGAGHAFFSVDRPSYRVDAAKEGWKEIWKFFGTHLRSAS